MIKNFILVSVLLVFMPGLIAGQSENSIKIWKNKQYKQSIKSALLYKSGWELSLPIVSLNSDEKLHLMFDELDKKRRNYSYTIIHCGHDWQQSDLEPYEFIEGHEFHPVDEYHFSQNTLINYINYQAEFPNENFKIILPGNYILKVVEENNPETIVLTRRFYVVQKMIEISGDIINQRLPKHDGLHHQVNFRLNFDPSKIENPVGNFSFKIIQNQGLEKNFSTLKPSSIMGNTLHYEMLPGLKFYSGNEFRHFDLKNFKFTSENLQEINRDPNGYKVILKPDIDLSHAKYEYKKDLNGKRLIKIEGSDRSYRMADYCTVQFSLIADTPIEKGSFYICGSLSNWDFDTEYKLEYNETSKRFEKEVVLKQGYYNYKYVFKPENVLQANDWQYYMTEGNHFQTENEYLLMVYYKPYNKTYQALVGFLSINSQN
jgi:hypothetical protein